MKNFSFTTQQNGSDQVVIATVDCYDGISYYNNLIEATKDGCLAISKREIVATGNSLTEVISKAKEMKSLSSLKFMWEKKSTDEGSKNIYVLFSDSFTDAIIIGRYKCKDIVTVDRDCIKVFEESLIENIFDRTIESYEAALREKMFENKTPDDMAAKFDELFSKYIMCDGLDRGHLHEITFFNPESLHSVGYVIKIWYKYSDRKGGVLNDEVDFEYKNTHLKLKYSELGEKLFSCLIKAAEALDIEEIEQMKAFAAMK